jgi:hypothetical protein
MVTDSEDECKPVSLFHQIHAELARLVSLQTERQKLNYSQI